MHDNAAQERDIRLKTMLVMTGMDHLLELMDEQNKSSAHESPGNADHQRSTVNNVRPGSVTPEFLGLFQGLLNKFDAIEEKLTSIQTAHFALQHSCSSANEVAQSALAHVQRGNPYLSQIDNILSHQSDHDMTEHIISAASEMISVARRDTEAFIEAIQAQTASAEIARSATDHTASTADAGSTSLLQSVIDHFSATPQLRIA